MKKKLLYELLEPNSKVSSKRFSGLILLGLFSLGTIMSMFIYINPTSVELLKMLGILGGSLLGANAFETAMGNLTKNKTNDKN